MNKASFLDFWCYIFASRSSRNGWKSCWLISCKITNADCWFLDNLRLRLVHKIPELIKCVIVLPDISIYAVNWNCSSSWGSSAFLTDMVIVEHGFFVLYSPSLVLCIANFTFSAGFVPIMLLKIDIEVTCCFWWRSHHTGISGSHWEGSFTNRAFFIFSLRASGRVLLGGQICRYCVHHVEVDPVLPFDWQHISILGKMFE